MTSILLPTEVIDYIETFSPEHREKYSETLQQLNSLYFKRILKKIRREFLDTSLSISYIMLKKIGKTELERWSKNVFDCNCCHRHQNNKELIEDNEVTVVTRHNVIHTFVTDYHDQDTYCVPDDVMCACDCRHLGRMLSRIITYA